MIDQEKFKSDFKSIVYLKSQIIDANKHIAKMTAYDKNGSHKKAIERAIEKRNLVKQEFTEKLNGELYEVWSEKSKALSLLNSKLKLITTKKQQIENQIIIL